MGSCTFDYCIAGQPTMVHVAYVVSDIKLDIVCDLVARDLYWL